MYIDTHSHLNDKSFIGDLDDVIKRALEEGVGKIIVPGYDLPSSYRAVEIAEKYDCCFAAVGVHPHDAKTFNHAVLNEIERLACSPKVIAVGEIGLDFYYNFSEPDIQKEALIAQIKMGVKTGKPLIFHSRESQTDLIEILKEYCPDGCKGVVHCFSGNSSEAELLLGMGFYLGFTGVVTFNKSHDLRDIVKKIPLERILSETDAPYMAPAPYRGKRCEPAYVRFVTEKIAEVKSLTVEQTISAISSNASELLCI